MQHHARANLQHIEAILLDTKLLLLILRSLTRPAESHDGLPGDASAVRDLELPAGPFHDPVRRHDHPSNWIIFPQKHVHLQDAR